MSDKFREKMEEYNLFIERRPAYYDDGLILQDEKQSSRPDKIDQSTRKRKKNNGYSSNKNVSSGSRFSQRLINNHNLGEKRTIDLNVIDDSK